MANLAARLEERAGRHPDRVALVEGRGRRRRAVTFGELAERVARVGAGLAGRGLEPGERVLLFVPMSIDLYASLLGVLHAGGVAVFVDAWADRRRLEAAVAAAAPRAFIGTARSQLLRLWSPGTRRIPLRVVTAPWWPGGGSLHRLDGGERAAVELEGDRPALVTFTTGSTGRPKAAARSHAFLWAQHRVLARHLELRDDDVDLPTLPVFVLNNLALGVTTVLPSFDPRRPADIDPATILDQMADEGVTTTSGSPAFYDRLARHVEARGGRIPVRRLFTGGAPVFPPLARRLVDATDGRVTVLYGSTEAEPIAGIDAPDLVAAAREDDARGVCAGPPVPEIGLRLIRPVAVPVALGPGGWDAWEVAPGAVGEVVVSGDHVLPGYLDDPGADAENKVRDGDVVWHRTGDAARLDDRGRLWLMGRIARRVEREGRTHWSMAVEAAALTVPGVAHVAYLEVPAAVGSTPARAVLAVELAGTGTAARTGEADLEAALRSAVSPAPVDEVRVMKRIPRDPRHASKTDTVKLLARLG